MTLLSGFLGAGKTTLLRSISGLIRNEAAQIRFRDRAIGAERPDMVGLPACMNQAALFRAALGVLLLCWAVVAVA